MLMKNAPFFFKIPIFDECYEKYILNVSFLDDIGCFLYFLKYALPTPPVGYYFLLLNIYTFMNKFYQTILAGKSFDKRSISDRFTYLDKHRSKVLSHLGTLTFWQSDILAFKPLGYSSPLRHLGTQSTLALKELKHSRHWDTQRALEYSGTQGTSSLEALYLADSRVLRSLSF